MRKPPADRLEGLLEAATNVFAERGYQRAQMADIAREMGVSPGALYLYVESKEALFSLVLAHASGHDDCPAPNGFPVPTPPPGAILERLASHATDAQKLPSLTAALETESAEDPVAELSSIVTEFYTMSEQHRRVLDVLERSALDWPELAAVFFRDIRGAFLDRLTRYLRRRMESGQLRQLPDASLGARFILESVSWFAWRRHHEPQDSALPPDTTRAAIVSLLVAALLP
ncbi:MAG TPA: TetR/AcrR family transcriptional regulator [Armatimonadota bacterium]|jgi:AcrR family transcriptional regulator